MPKRTSSWAPGDYAPERWGGVKDIPQKQSGVEAVVLEVGQLKQLKALGFRSAIGS